MSKIFYAGMDVHKDSIFIAVIDNENTVILEKSIPNQLEKIRRFFNKFRKQGKIISCYEAGCFGFELYRNIEEMGIECKIISPGHIAKKPGERIKTDKRDALKLARLLKNDEAAGIYVPSIEDEATRDFLRARDDLRIDLHKNRQRMLALLLRHRYRYTDGKNWTQKHYQWLRSIEFENDFLAHSFQTYYYQIKELEDKIFQIDQRIIVIAESDKYKDRVNKLRSFKGIDYLTALSILTEIGDFKRFSTASEFMAYLGLVPQIYASGKKRVSMSITKAGNTYLRRLLIEASWHYRTKYFISKKLNKRRIGQSEQTIYYANKAMERLHKKYHKMNNIGKPKQVIVTAISREMAGFIWGLMNDKVS